MRLALALGRTVRELERSLSHAEWIEWIAYYGLDPWGDQRDDMRMARLVTAVLAPHSKSTVNPADHMLFPEDRLDLPDEVSAQEQQWMLALKRNEGN
jgi:hypothetical protein